ncbi:MAG: FCSD flavin-binding domain-containing protein, partial [Rhodomicrobium sp.]
DMPKSAFAANSQAQVAAQAIKAELLGEGRQDAEYHNACWSLISTEDSVKIGATYKATPQKIQEASSFISGMNDGADIRRQNFRDSMAWYAKLTSELFG